MNGRPGYILRSSLMLIGAVLLLLNLPLLNSAEAQDTAEVIITWTSPGDDGAVGTAAQYDIRYSADSSTAANWNSATQAVGEPVPLIAGTTQDYTMYLAEGVWYFAIKTRDEAFNWSSRSNVARVVSSNTDVFPPIVLRWE